MNEKDLNLTAYDFDLPKELIAQLPAEKREHSRLLVINRKSGQIEHTLFKDMGKFLRRGDCLVINKTKVIPARLFGKKETGGRIEALFIEKTGDNEWSALLRPFLEEGRSIIFPGGLTARIERKTEIGETVLNLKGAELKDVLEEHGRMPLPPYIKRQLVAGEQDRIDRERYQTVYAQNEGSIAAPTAGLHFTNDLLEELKTQGVEIAGITLHVGWGTFRPVTSPDISKHNMLPEYYEIDPVTAAKIRRAKKEGGRVIPVGTTTARALESAAAGILGGGTDVIRGKTSIFIYPGHEFRIPDAFITNFHLPKSTPLFMACAFAGKEKVFKAYEEAIKLKYRFFSYGDSMFIL